MILIRHRKQGSYLSGLTAEGHSGYASSGEDIVCAGVSALVQALAIGLTEVLQMPSVQVAVNEEKPSMSVTIESPDERSELLCRTILLSLKAMEASYSRYMTVLEVD